MVALQPYRADVIVIGGWAHRLSRLHPLAQSVDFQPLGTQDVDLAIPANLAPRREDLGKVLVDAGFHERFVGENRPPVTHYQFGEEPGFYAEFLTPLVGRARAATKTIAGVSAQALRHLDILMIDPWSVVIREPEYRVGKKSLEIRLTNATSYLAQKILTLGKRRAQDRAKDVLYIHDTVITFGRSLTALERLWTSSVSGSIHSAGVRALRRASEELFSEVTEVARRASRIATEAGRPVSPGDLCLTCRTGLTQIFI